MATVRELVTSWGFDINEKPLKELDKSINGMKSTLKTIGITAVAAAGSLFGIALGTAKAGDEAYKTSQKIGVNTEALQALRYAAELADIGQAELTTGLKFLSTKMYDASRGAKESQRSFKELGVTYKDQNGNLLSADKMLGSIADKFKDMPDGTKKTALAVDIFGRAGIQMIPMLNEGSAAISKLTEEAKLFGLVIDESSAKSYQEFNDSITRIKGIVVGFRNEIGKELIPVMTDMMHKIIDWIKMNRELLSQRVKSFVAQLVLILHKFWKMAIVVGKTVANLVELFGGFEKAVGFLTKAFITFLSIKIIAGIGGIVQSVLVAIKAFTALGNAALLAQIKMAAIPLAIGAIIAALYLVIEDIVGFFQGKDSALGLLIDGLKESAPGVFNAIKIIIDQTVAAALMLVSAFMLTWRWMMKIAEKANAVFKPIVDMFKEWVGLLTKVFGGINSAAKRQGSLALGKMQSGTNTMNNATNFMDRLIPNPAVSSAAGGIKNTEIKPNINVSVTGGMTNEQTGGIIADQISRVFSDMMIDAGRDFEPVIER